MLNISKGLHSNFPLLMKELKSGNNINALFIILKCSNLMKCTFRAEFLKHLKRYEREYLITIKCCKEGYSFFIEKKF